MEEYWLERKQVVAVWSDCWQAEAARFADSHRDLLLRRITEAHLGGLSNVARAARCYADIERFVRHQAELAERSGRLDVQEYWNDLRDALDGLRGEAEVLLETLPLPAGVDRQEALDDLHRELARLYIQHLIAHSAPIECQSTKNQKPTERRNIMARDFYVKYQDDPWEYWATIGWGHPSADEDACNRKVVFITNLTLSEARYVCSVAWRLLGAAWEPNQSPEQREWNSKIIEECQEILDWYINRNCPEC